MNVPDSKDYLEKQLSGVSVEIIQNWKGQKNNRYEFSKPGIEKPAAILLGQSLPLGSDMLDDIAVAVNKKFSEAPISFPKKQEVQETVGQEAQPTPYREEAQEPVFKPKETADYIHEAYVAAKRFVEAYEKDNPMT